MKPTKFKESNMIFGANQKGYEPLPAFRDTKGEVITRWRLSLRERIRVLIKGEIWLSLQTFNRPINPSFITTKKKDLLL